MQRAALWLLASAQALLFARVLLRFARTAHGEQIAPAAGEPAGRVAVIVPVLDEEQRLGLCLDGLARQDAALATILVVDGGSGDGTTALVRQQMPREPRLRLLEAGPPPPGWNGKAWNLHSGLAQLDNQCDWLLTIDADVRPAPGLVRALVLFAERRQLAALSVAARQELASNGLALLHPALLTTLVYRFGLPGGATRDPRRVQANGQCMLLRRDALQRIGGFAAVRDSRCEDVTLARLLARARLPVGFYEAGDLVSTEMYGSAAEAWRNWPRSLPLLDSVSGAAGWLGLVEVTLVQALPLPALLLALCASRRRPTPVVGLLVAMAAVRVGVLIGTARAYRRRPRLYWLSPLLDLPVAVALWRSALQRRPPLWRGRRLAR